MPYRALLMIIIVTLACSPATLLTNEADSPDSDQSSNSEQVEQLDLNDLPDASEIDLQNPPQWLQSKHNDVSPAPEPQPLTVSYQLSEAHQVAQVMGERGGTLTLAGPEGVTYSLTIPEGGLLSEETITMTHITSVEGVTADGGALAAVVLQPSGLVFLKPAKLRINVAQIGDQSGYVGFGGETDGDNVHGIVAVEVGESIEIAVNHFSMTGTVSGVRSDNAKLLQATILGSVPSGTANYYKQQIQQAYEQLNDDDFDVDEFFAQFTRAKHDWFWRQGDGVHFSILDAAVRTVDAGTNRINEPHLLERAIADYIDWYMVQGDSMKNFYLISDHQFPFDDELAIANFYMTQALKEGLEADCYRPIDAMYKVRFYRLALALSSSNRIYGMDPFAATNYPDFTQDKALELVQDCARFKVDYVTGLTLELPTMRWNEAGQAEGMPYVFDENPDPVVFEFTAPPEHWQSELT